VAPTLTVTWLLGGGVRCWAPKSWKESLHKPQEKEVELREAIQHRGMMLNLSKEYQLRNELWLQSEKSVLFPYLQNGSKVISSSPT
jgi:hypothetical protein